jgi:hypothetical protein
MPAEHETSSSAEHKSSDGQKVQQAVEATASKRPWQVPQVRPLETNDAEIGPIPSV